MVIRIAVAIFSACIVQRLLLLIRHAAAIDKVPQADLQQVDRRQVDLLQQQGLKADVAAPYRRFRVHLQPAVAVVGNAVEDP